MNCSGPIMTENQAIRTIGCSFFIDLVPLFDWQLSSSTLMFQKGFSIWMLNCFKISDSFLGVRSPSRVLVVVMIHQPIFPLHWFLLIFIWQTVDDLEKSVCSGAVVITLSLFIFSSFCHATSFPLGYLHVQAHMPS